MRWTLEIGGVSLRIEGPARWVTPFERAWGWWSGQSPGWIALLEEDKDLPPPQAPLFTVLPRFRDGLCLLEAPGFEGEIAPGEKRARLRAHPEASPGDVAYFLRTAFALCAFEAGAVLFHAAGLVHRGEAFAFFGPSGSGKTTLARLSAGKEVLSDDLLLLCPLPGEGKWEARATPFSLCRGARLSAPLRALMRLVKAEEDKLMPLPPAVALGEAVASSPVVNADPQRLPELFARWEEILKEVPAFALHFRKSNAFWEVIDAELGRSAGPGPRGPEPSDRR